MESLWGVYCDRRKDRSSYEQYSFMVYIHFLSYPWFTCNYLHDPSLLDEHEALYLDEQKEPTKVAIKGAYFRNL